MKVLVDTSVWIGHLKSPVHLLSALLANQQVLSHSAVVGELACGNLKNRSQFLSDLILLPAATEATPSLTLEFIERHGLSGSGLGWVDVQLLASAKLSDARLLSRDRRLGKVAVRLELAA